MTGDKSRKLWGAWRERNARLIAKKEAEKLVVGESLKRATRTPDPYYEKQAVLTKWQGKRSRGVIKSWFI